MVTLETTFWLRPGPLPNQVVRDVLRTLVEELQWRPTTFGSLARCDHTIANDGVDDIVAFYASEGRLLIRGAEIECLFSPDRPHHRTAIGAVVLYVHCEEPVPRSLVERHLSIFANVAKALDSPYAHASLSSDKRRKATRRIRRDAREIALDAQPGIIEQEVSKVRTYRAGLDALYWRNIFGSEFVEMFGASLLRLPSDVARDIGDGRWLVQAYGEPGEAFTAAGERREREIVAHLGPECFYDDTSEQAPTRVPVFLEHVDPHQLRERAFARRE